MNNEFFINENISDEMKLAFMQEMTVRESSENEKAEAVDNAIDAINYLDDITEDKKLLGVKLYDGMGPIIAFPMSSINVISLNGVNISHMAFYRDDGKFKYDKRYCCSRFYLVVEKDKFGDGMVEDFLALPDILGVELIYRNHPNEYYFIPEEYEEGKGPLLLESREKVEFKGTYNNNLCQRNGIASWNKNLLFLEINENRRY